MKIFPSNVFRANVGVVVINQDGLVLALERSDHTGAWQLPQGGLDEGETPLEAAYREMEEETGLAASDVQLLMESPEWLAYELPEKMRGAKHGRGQVQKWFLYRLVAADTQIRLDAHGHREFAAWKWMPLRDLIKITVAFRQPVYKHLSEHFAPYLN